MNAQAVEIDLGEKLFKELTPQHKNMAIRHFYEFPKFEDFADMFGARVAITRMDFRETWNDRELPNAFVEKPIVPGRSEQLMKYGCEPVGLDVQSIQGTDYSRIHEVSTKGLRGRQVEPISLVYFHLQAVLQTSNVDGSRQGLLEGLKARLSLLDVNDVNQKHKIRDLKRTIQHIEREEEVNVSAAMGDVFCETENWYTELEDILNEQAQRHVEIERFVERHRDEIREELSQRYGWKPLDENGVEKLEALKVNQTKETPIARAKRFMKKVLEAKSRISL